MIRVDHVREVEPVFPDLLVWDVPKIHPVAQFIQQERVFGTGYAARSE